MTPVRGRLWHAHRSERGQVLILFVAMFTVVLAMAAFAIDQGFWFGRRRVAQHAADAAARSGAVAFLSTTNPLPLSPCKQAVLTATQNGLSMTNFDPMDPDECEAPHECVTAQVQESASSLFAGAFGIDGIDVGAQATACAGTVLGVRADDGGDGPQGISIALSRGDDCFAGGKLQPGRECVVWGALDGTQHNRLLWSSAGDCAGDPTGAPGEISDGVRFSCVAGDVIGTTNIPDDPPGSQAELDQDNVLLAFRDRLGRPTTCASLEPGQPNRASFRNALGNGDGSPEKAEPPPPFGGSGDRDAFFVQNDCLDNPRLVIMPVTDAPLSGGSGSITGIAIVYLTGCYEQGAIPEPNPTAETNTCDQAPYPPLTRKLEVRGVPVRVYITKGANGELGDIDDSNWPLTVETTQ